MSLRVSSAGLGFAQAVKHNRSYQTIRRNKKTYCTVPKRESESMDKEQEKKPSAQHNESTNKHGDVMTHSFGEGYGTRSEEEGFGGIYGQNDPSENPGHPFNHPDYDTSQGCEVKEKERARNSRDV